LAAITPPLRARRAARASSVRRRGFGVRDGLTLAALAPITVLLATRLHEVDAFFTYYMVFMISTLAVTFYVAFARYRDPSTGEAVEAAPSASLMVAVKNERDVIEDCVASLVGQTYADLEVIVVDDGSGDGTTEILERLADADPRIRLLRNDASQGKKKALTRACAEARGAILLFTDSDCVLKLDAVEKMIDAFRANPGFGAFSGHARALNADRNVLTRMQDAWYETSFSINKAAESVFGGVTCVSGPLAGFRREAIYNFLPAWAEDRFLGAPFPFATDRQLTGYVLGGKEKGATLKRRFQHSPFVRETDYPNKRWKVGYVKAARVLTEVPDTPRRLAKQQIRWKKSFLRNLAFTGTFYWRRGPGAALLFYGHALFVLLAPVMALRHMVLAPLAGEWALAPLYIAGITFKGSMWAVAYRVENPQCRNWVYRPLMSLTASIVFSWMLLYSALTLRRGVWSRG
jgi:cellulose synthase/poly-beta-1,6-N-acetylglucosamine synthase-like glycosyltransferase